MSQQVITNIIDQGMNIQAAIDAPHIHQWMPDEIVEESIGLSPETRRALEARGHHFAPEPQGMSDLQGIMVEEKTNVRLGGSDSRQNGAALGY